MLSSVVVVLLFSSISYIDANGSDLPGHMKPLGSHRPPVQLERLTIPPTPLQFAEYVSRRQPVLIEQLMSDTQVINNWQNDSYIREKYGSLRITIEYGKKENRSEGGSVMAFSEYLNRYKDEDIYLVGNMPEQMQQEWLLPKFFLCGGYTRNIVLVYMWFSSGGTKSVLHSDSSENLHCVVSGQKRFILIEQKYASKIGQEYFTKGYFDVDVEKVDMTKYPGLAEVPWLIAEVRAGDCLYIPMNWIHQVNSFGRNFGVNIWWIPFQFKPDECSDADNMPPFGSLGSVLVSSELQIKQFLMENARPDGTIHATDAHEILQERAPEDLAYELVKKMFDTLKPGCKGVLTVEEVNSFSLEQFKAAETFISESLGVAEDMDDSILGHDDGHNVENNIHESKHTEL